MYDVAIIGLGPAGATLARLLDSRFSIAIIDKKVGDGTGFHKPCGGLLAPDAQKAISHFNLTLPKEVLVDPQIFAVRTYDFRTQVTRHYQRFYINLDRHKFDLWLKSLVPEHVAVFDASTCTKIERRGNEYELSFFRNDKVHNITAKYIVGADGANSVVRRFLYPHKEIRSYVSIQQWFAETHVNPFYSCIFDPDITDCYSWTISKDGYSIFGGAYPKDRCLERFESQKQRLTNRGFCFDTPLKTESCLVLRPSKPGDFCTGKNNAFLVGEAGGFISPSSLEGISSAMKTAYTLSQVLNSLVTVPGMEKLNPCEEYRRKTLGLRIKLLLKIMKCPFMYFPPLRKMVMLAGINSIHVMEKIPSLQQKSAAKDKPETQGPGIKSTRL
ncbi:MAG: FAD-binding protein [Bacillota bacterium]|jgi:flavin-dependent dehydrogenase